MKKVFQLSLLLSLPTVITPTVIACSNTPNNLKTVSEILNKQKFYMPGEARTRTVINSEKANTQENAIHELITNVYPNNEAINEELTHLFFKELQKTGDSHNQHKSLLDLERDKVVEIEILTNSFDVKNNAWQFETVTSSGSSTVEAYLRFKFRVDLVVAFLKDGPEHGYENYKQGDTLRYSFEGRSDDLWELRVITNSGTTNNSYLSSITLHDLDKTGMHQLLGIMTHNDGTKGIYPITFNNMAILTGWDQNNALMYHQINLKVN